jgi:exopolyphosphatase/guanosine-5'-triphosphate,3'-diphosphate pyrophosphatase
VIAIDLGSNTIRFLAVDSEGNELWEAQYVVRTAENLVQTGAIGRAALERIADAIAKAKERFDFSGRAIAAVATESFRQAKNQKEALAFLSENCGVDFEVIAARTEAQLTAIAVSDRARRGGLKEPFIALDIGGASSEAIYVRGGVFKFVSLPIGIVTTSERNLDDRALGGFLDEALGAIDAFNEAIAALPRADVLLATAGVPTTLAAIKLGLTYENYDKKIVGGAALNVNEIIAARKNLASLDREEAEKLTGKDRRDLIVTGAIMLERFMKKLGFDRLIVFDEGLREGVAARALEARAKPFRA